MKNYIRVMLGRGSVYAAECVAGNFIGANFGIEEDLSAKLSEQWREFNKNYIPVFLKANPDKTRVAAGLACGALWTVAKGIRPGDIVLSPDGAGHYHVGEITGEYYYQPDGILPHRRPIHWFDKTIARNEMSESLRRSCGAIGTTSNVSGHAEEIERFIAGFSGDKIIATDPTIEDPAAFAMERHLEDFLVQNWSHTELGRKYHIYEEEGEQVGRQYPTDTGPIDILAISNDNKTLLVLELKKGRASDMVVGQILRYMGYVKEELAEENQEVRGAIIALEDDQRIRRALAMVPTVEFYRYEVRFHLRRA